MVYLPAILYIMSNYLQKGADSLRKKEIFAPFDQRIKKGGKER